MPEPQQQQQQQQQQPPPPPHDIHPHRSPYRAHLNSSVASLNPSSSSPLKQPTSQPIDFDEGVLRTLCGLECGFPLVVDRLKQAVGTSREVGMFLKKKSQLEEEYGLKLAKISRERLEAYTHLGGEVKAGSFGRQYSNFLSTHERMAIERTEYATRLNAIADELVNLSKEVERIRKANKDVGWRLEKNLTDSEGLTEKAKAKFDVTVEELERLLMSKQAENSPGGVSSSNSAGLAYSASSSSTQPKSVNQAKALGKAISKLAAKGARSAGHLARMEDEVRSRMGTVSDAYRAQVLATQQVRQEYFNLQLPKILRTLKEHSDETDLAIQYYLANYSTLSESLLVSEALSVSALPAEQPRGSIDESASSEVDNQARAALSLGLKDIIQSIDNRADFKEYMANYAAHFNQTHHAQLATQGGNPTVSSGATQGTSSQSSLAGYGGNPSGSLSHGAYPQAAKVAAQQLPGESPRTSTSSNVLTIESKKTFGVDLATQMIRDGIETVPKVVEKCVQAVEKAGGIEMMGIYRLSGTTSKIARLKQRFDTDIDNVKLEVGDENQSEINDIAGAMKLWFRELPEPLLTWNLYGTFIEAGRIENHRLRHIRLHERVNELPDPNYATLKYLMGHLDKIRRNEAINSMGASNLAVIFGPTLLSPPPINFYNHPQSFQPPNDPALLQNSHLGSSAANRTPWNSAVPNAPNPPPNNHALQDMSVQCKVVETILEHYREIFVDEGEEEEVIGGDPETKGGAEALQGSERASQVEEGEAGGRQSLVSARPSLTPSGSSFDLKHLSLDSHPPPPPA